MKPYQINYHAIRTGDVIGTADTLHAMSCVTRLTCGGLRGLFSTRVSSHIVVACESHGLMYGMEMGHEKIRMVDLREYEHGRMGNHIVFVGRHIDLPVGLENAVEKWLHRSHELAIKYDHLELLKFLDIPVKDCDHTWICSDLPREMFRHFQLQYPARFNSRVSPYDWQRSDVLNHIHWWR
jgi:hypothetical protein